VRTAVPEVWVHGTNATRLAGHEIGLLCAKVSFVYSFAIIGVSVLFTCEIQISSTFCAGYAVIPDVQLSDPSNAENTLHFRNTEPSYTNHSFPQPDRVRDQEYLLGGLGLVSTAPSAPRRTHP
jgi:hypothetical protein